MLSQRDGQMTERTNERTRKNRATQPMDHGKWTAEMSNFHWFQVSDCDQPPPTSPTPLKTLTKTSWFSLLVAPIFFSDFRWLCVWWSTGFLSAFMAHKGSGASIGIECLFYLGGRKVPMQGVSVLFRFWFVHLSDSDSLKVDVSRAPEVPYRNYWVSAIKKMANKTLKF